MKIPGFFTLSLLLLSVVFSSAHALSTSTNISLTNDTFNGLAYYMHMTTSPNYTGPPVPFTKTYSQFTIVTQNPDHSCSTTSYGMEVQAFDTGTVLCTFTFNIKICLDDNYADPPTFTVQSSYSNLKNASGTPDYCLAPTFGKSGSSMNVIVTSFNPQPAKK